MGQLRPVSPLLPDPKTGLPSHPRTPPKPRPTDLPSYACPFGNDEKSKVDTPGNRSCRGLFYGNFLLTT